MKKKNIFRMAILSALALAFVKFDFPVAKAQIADNNNLPDYLLTAAKHNSGWWGKINTSGVAVRSGPSASSKKLGSLSSVNRIKILDEAGDGDATWYKIDGGDYPGAYVLSTYVTPIAQPMPDTNVSIPDSVKTGDLWIDVNISKETLTLFDYDQPIFTTYVSTGRKVHSTVTGIYRIWSKFQKTRMHGGPPVVDHVYDLPNVPYTMYYHGSFAVHGTYWHDKFGTPQSAGCTNLTQGDARFIFNKVDVGTVVYNHY